MTVHLHQEENVHIETLRSNTRGASDNLSNGRVGMKILRSKDNCPCEQSNGVVVRSCCVGRTHNFDSYLVSLICTLRYVESPRIQLPRSLGGDRINIKQRTGHRELNQRLTEISLPQSITPYNRCALVFVLLGVACKTFKSGNVDTRGESIGPISICSVNQRAYSTTSYQKLLESQRQSRV